ncbi:hypothetical protein FRC06_007705, partial [Ceratobasidium sp. 370]
MSDVSSRSSCSSPPPDFPLIGDRLKDIDRELPEITDVSLGQWLEIWQNLHSRGRLRDRNVFGLTGHYTDSGTGAKRRARLEPWLHTLQGHHISQFCDIDSIIGLVYNQFPTKNDATLKYFMLLSPMHALNENLHIPPVTYTDADGNLQSVHLHTIPNTRFAEMDPQTLIRIFFPRLDKRQSALKDSLMASLYDGAAQPAAMECIPEELRGNWPASYPNETWRAQNVRATTGDGQTATGARQYTGREVHSPYLNPWIGRIRELVDAKVELAWARSFFFGVELRGMKKREESMHQAPEDILDDDDNDEDMPNRADDRRAALARLLAGFDLEAIDRDHENWYVDIATTISVASREGRPAGCVFAWDVTHPYILNWATNADLHQCMQWVEGEGGYYAKDETSQLGAMAGFRFTNPQGADTGIHYVQLYFSSKSVAYNLAVPGKSKQISPRMVLQDWQGVVSQHFSPLLKVFHDSAGTHGVALRLESRVSWTCYRHVHPRIPDPVVRPWLLHVRNSVYWGWLHARLLSIFDVLSHWMAARSSYTKHDLSESGSALVLLSWMANALLKRPAEGSHWDEVRDAGSVHTVFEGRLTAYRPLTQYYLHTLVMELGKLPRISSQRTVSMSTLLYLFSKAGETVELIRLHAMIVQEDPPRPPKRPATDPWASNEAGPPSVVQERRNNRQRIVHTTSAVATEDKFQGLIPEPERARYPSEERDFEERERPTTNTQLLTDIIYDLPIQIFEKAPNHGLESWCSLDPLERSEVSFDLFCSMDNLETALKSCVMFGSQRDKWDAAVANLFPTIKESLTPRQNYSGLGA